MKLDNPFILAPMAGITDMPFRRLMKRMGVGCVISEFVSAHAVCNQKAKKIQDSRYLKFHEDERPVGIQLFGGNEAMLAGAAKRLEDIGVDFVDLNLGCPVPKVTKKGGGSAWLCHPVELGKMLSMVKKAIRIPLTIKIRTGWDHESINAHEVVNIASQEGIEWVAIHGRTRTQGYAGTADWDLIGEIAKRSSMKIVGNGDLVSGPLAAARLVDSGCFGVMIGRGALKNPWIFLEAVEALEKFEAADLDKTEVLQEIFRYHKMPSAGDVPEGQDYYQKKVKKLQPTPVNFVADWVNIRKDRDPLSLIQLHLSLLREVYNEKRVQLNLRKFLAWYSAGYPGCHQFRKDIFTTDDFEYVIARAVEFFDGVKKMGRGAEDSREAAPVLMSGHG